MLAGAMILPPTASLARTPAELSDLVGARAAGAETAMTSRGYHQISHTQGEDRIWSYRWHGARKQCVAVTVFDGRYHAVEAAPASDCNQSSGGGDKTAAAVVGAAALIGVLALAHKSSHHDDGIHYDDHRREADYERGYRDGLYNQTYHNYDRASAYSDGYQAGVRQRGYETPYQSHHHHGGGYSGYGYVNDLVGRQRDDANSELAGRGFVMKEVDKTEHEGRYTTWWRSESRQCIIVHSRDGRVLSVEDVANRNCR